MVEGSGLIDSENARFSLRFHVAVQNVFMQFYAISKQEIEQPVSPFDFIFVMFPMKVVGDRAHCNRRKSSAPGPY